MSAISRALSSLAEKAVAPLVPLSFSRPGYWLRRRADEAPSERDLRGAVCLITGANSGIGFATSRALAERGARVVMLCRSEARGRTAMQSLQQATGGEIRLARIDLADLTSVRACAHELDEERIDLLVHNAGVLPETREETADGCELTFATHVLGPFELTRLLAPRLARAGDARVITVSSGGMYTRGLQLADPDWRARPYDGVVAYAETKRAQVVLTEELARHYPTIAFHAMHPGWADTPAVRTSLPRFYELTRRILRTPAEGADTVVWLAAVDRIPGPSGSFWFDRRRASTVWLPGTGASAGEAAALWELCERRAHRLTRADGAPF